MKLKKGDMAIPFRAKDNKGREVNLESCRGKNVLLSFYRHSACPLCNLRLHELMAKYPDYEKRGLKVIAVFQSPAEHLDRDLQSHKAPFSLVADPEMKLYEQYGVETSWPVFLKSNMLPSVMKRYYQAMRLGFPPDPTKTDGPFPRVPADFLIGPDMRIMDVNYGSLISDHISFDRIDQFLRASELKKAA